MAELPPASTPPSGPVLPPAPWKLRFALAQIIQLPVIGLLIVGQPPWAAWTAGAIGSIICCAATDSRWRWMNRLLVAQAIAWLVVALSST